jgi:hypothetical protein
LTDSKPEIGCVCWRDFTGNQSGKNMNVEKIKLLAKDLTKEFPRSPRETLAGYVLAARCVDKCRAEINNTLGEFHYNCPLDKIFLSFAEIDAQKLKDFVATGANDAEVAQWITANAKKRERVEIIQWNNKQRDLRLSDLKPETQEFMEDYIQKFVPRNRPVYHWFDVFDLEEQRI